MSIDWDKRQGTLGKHRHLASDVLDEVTGGLPAGTAQTVSLLGPFRVSFANANLTNLGGHIVADIAAGVRVIRAWAEIGEDDPFVAVGGTTMTRLRVELRDAADPGNTLILTDYDQPNVSDNFTGYFVRTENSTIVGGPVVGTAVVACKLSARVVCNTNAPNLVSAGSADIYALIALPA